jgi:hypothetical protein
MLFRNSRSLRAVHRRARILPSHSLPLLLLAFLAGTLVLLPGCEPWTDSGKMVGKWDLGLNGLQTWEFKSDGTFIWTAPLNETRGTWRIENGRLKIDTPGLMWGENHQNYAYRFEGDKLWVSDGKEQSLPGNSYMVRIP